MILVDTSVWIEFFKQNNDFIRYMESLLKNRQVITIEPIFSELIFGAKNDKEKNYLLAYWKILPKIKFSSDSLLHAADFASSSNYCNLGIGLIDAVIILAAVENSCRIFTLDKKIIRTIDKDYLFLT
ncbi:MAG: PIN domain-containing protein [Bacteroidales bacterium]|nr:PIN domain-containing protein [Bacteroidales bacterium]